MAVIRTLGSVTLATVSLLLLEPAIGQRSGTGTSPPPSGGGTPTGSQGGRGPGSTTTTPGTTTPDTIRNQPNSISNVNQPIYLSGRVMADDGSALPINISIERVCGAKPHIEGHTDSKGYFSIQLGANNVDAFQDASNSSSGDITQGELNRTGGGFNNGGSFSKNSAVSERALAGCQLRASIPGYVSQTVELAMRRAMDNPDIGTILVHRIADTEGRVVSATALSAPNNARKALQKGYDLEKKKELDRAATSFQQAVDAYPKYAEAWFELGRVQAAQAQTELAHKSFDEAIRADSKFVRPYIEISLLELHAQRWQELADITDKALRLDPFSFPQAFFLNALAYYNLKHVDLAEQSARRAQKLDTRHQIPQVSRLLGVILADRHDYAGAAEQMRDYLRFAPQEKDAADVRSQLEALEKQLASAPQQQ